jgi:tripartite-type tricarboxylate transporter receptor subunit TctC
MKLPRRKVLQLATGAVALPLVSRIALAQTYPTQTVRLMVGFTAGQAIDILARIVGQWLSERLAQPFVIENRPGAGGNIAAEAVVRAPPDGYTLLVIGANNAINATLYKKLSFNLVQDIAPVASIYRVHQVLVVEPSFPAATVGELIAYAKANPGKLNFASAGNGSVAHMTAELFKMMTGTSMVHVPYRGAPAALTDLFGGHVHLMFDNLPSSIEYIKSGRLRALGVSSRTRLEFLPDVPTIGDTVPAFETAAFAGLGAPKETPAPIIDTLNKEVNLALADSRMKARIAEIGGSPLSLSPAGFAQFFSEETEKWAKVVRAASLGAE